MTLPEVEGMLPNCQCSFFHQSLVSEVLQISMVTALILGIWPYRIAWGCMHGCDKHAMECKPNKSSKQVIKQLFSVTFLGRCIPYYLDDELDLMCSFFPLASGSTIASYLGRMGGGKVAWYWLLVHAWAFPEKLGIRVCLEMVGKINTYTSDLFL